ncbi:hypothetical protein B0H10DRAFT_1686714, partial [Mycena sp. CBHHK59/15]
MEIGSPMASLYVLGNPDHYKSHKFVLFWWKSHVEYIRRYWQGLEEIPNPDELNPPTLVSISKQDGKFIASDHVDDYRFRPRVYEHLTLYEWIQSADKKARTRAERQ